MAQIIWSHRSAKDLESIAKYIAFDSEYAAEKFIQEILKKVDLLRAHPEKGHPIPESIPGSYRQILHKSYRIIYRVEKKNILISSVYHQKNYYLKYKTSNA